jgi:AcrR family transcriptional regulator
MSMQDDKTDKRQRLKEARAAQILDAAARVFAKKGYQRATTREIAAEAGVAEGTIYNYFKSKRHLLIAMASRLATESLEQIRALPPVEDEGEYVAAIVTSRFELFLENIDLARALMLEMLVSDDLRQDYMKEVLSPAISFLGEYIRSRTEAGTFRKVKPEIVARAIIGGVMSFGLLWLQHGELDEESLRELASEVVGLYLDGLRVRPTEGKDQ